MNRRLPPEAFAHYLKLGAGRSYQAVADHFGVSKQSVVALAAKEDWPTKLAQAEKRLGEAAARKAEESIEQMNDRHLRLMKAIQGRGLETLKASPIKDASAAANAIINAVKQERVIRGEPGDRSSIEISDVIKREYERWLAPASDDPTGDAGEGVGADDRTERAAGDASGDTAPTSEAEGAGEEEEEDEDGG